MYDRHDHPDFTFSVASLRSFGRLLRQENRAVLLEAAGQVCGWLSGKAIDTSLVLGAHGRVLRTLADAATVTGPPPAQHRRLDRPLSEAEERAAAMRRHPSSQNRRDRA